MKPHGWQPWTNAALRVWGGRRPGGRGGRPVGVPSGRDRRAVSGLGTSDRDARRQTGDRRRGRRARGRVDDRRTAATPALVLARRAACTPAPPHTTQLVVLRGRSREP